jgi:hypothetical protein
LVSNGVVSAEQGLSTNGMTISKNEGTTFRGGNKYNFDGNVEAPKFIGDVEANYVLADNISADNLLATEA